MDLLTCYNNHFHVNKRTSSEYLAKRADLSREREWTTPRILKAKKSDSIKTVMKLSDLVVYCRKCVPTQPLKMYLVYTSFDANQFISAAVLDEKENRALGKYDTLKWIEIWKHCQTLHSLKLTTPNYQFCVRLCILVILFYTLTFLCFLHSSSQRVRIKSKFHITWTIETGEHETHRRIITIAP